MTEQTAQEPRPASEPAADSNAETNGSVLRCPSCGALVGAHDAFCENCRHPLSPQAEAPVAEVSNAAAPIELSRSLLVSDREDDEDTVPITRPCSNCGGTVGADGYCEICGMKALSERDHYTEQPAPWVAACCDKGVRHHRNEDATAIGADPQPGSRAVLVVCDGVSTSSDSDVASLAGARAARDLLVASRPAGLGTPASLTAAMAQAIKQAATTANEAVVANTAVDSENAASCTFAAAVLEGDQIYFGNVGDSRTYWIPDPDSEETPVQLSVDDSVAQARITMGVPRDEAENGPQAHAITKWLGRDSPDFAPSTGTRTVGAPGWLLVCSDGLWNYVSEAADLQSLIAELGIADPDPLPLAVSLVKWANEQGGKDNIGVALARH
jgi:serine/threonine protein phosphatase PrpC